MRYSIVISAMLALFIAPSLFASDYSFVGPHDMSWSDHHVSHWKDSDTHCSSCESHSYHSCESCGYHRSCDSCSEFYRVDTTTKPTAVAYLKHVEETNHCEHCAVSTCSSCSSCDGCSRSYDVRYDGTADENFYYWR